MAFRDMMERSSTLLQINEGKKTVLLDEHQLPSETSVVIMPGEVNTIDQLLLFSRSPQIVWPRNALRPHRTVGNRMRTLHHTNILAEARSRYAAVGSREDVPTQRPRRTSISVGYVRRPSSADHSTRHVRYILGGCSFLVDRIPVLVEHLRAHSRTNLRHS